MEHLALVYHIKADIAGLSPGQKAAVTGIQGIEKEFSKLAQTVAPLTLAVFTSGLKLVNALMPVLLKFAVPAGEAIGEPGRSPRLPSPRARGSRTLSTPCRL